MRTVDREVRNISSTRSPRRTSKKKPSESISLPGFLPTSAESVRLALSFPLHSMPHDRVFGVYKEGFYNLISAYLWDLYQFNLVISACAEYVDITPISLENFSSGLVSFIKIVDSFSVIMELLLVDPAHSNSQEWRGTIGDNYNKLRFQLESQLRSYELQAQDIVRAYILALNTDIQDGIIKYQNKYKVGYSRLVEMYSEDISAINRLLGNVGLPFIMDRHLLGAGSVAKNILTTRILHIIKVYCGIETGYSPRALSPALEIRPMDGVLSGEDARVSMSVPRNIVSPTRSAGKRSLSRKVTPAQDKSRVVQQSNGSFVQRSATSYVGTREYRMDEGTQANYSNTMRQDVKNLDIRAQLMDIFAFQDVAGGNAASGSQGSPGDPSNAKLRISFTAQQEAEPLADRQRGPETVVYTSTSVQTGVELDLSGSRTTTVAVCTDPVGVHHRECITDACLQPPVQLVDTSVNTIGIMHTDCSVQTIADFCIVTNDESVEAVPTPDVILDNLEDIEGIVDNDTGNCDLRDSSTCVMVRETLLRALMGRIHQLEAEVSAEKGSIDLPKHMIQSVINTTKEYDSKDYAAARLIAVATATADQVPYEDTADQHDISGNHSPRIEWDAALFTHPPQPWKEPTSAQQTGTSTVTRTLDEFLKRYKLDSSSVKLSFAHGASLEISDGESLLQPAFDPYDQSSMTISADGYVGTAVLKQPRSLPELFYDLVSDETGSSTAHPEASDFMIQRPAEAEIILHAPDTDKATGPYTGQVDTNTADYRALYHDLLEKYAQMEEQSVQHVLRAEDLQKKVDVLTEEAESLRIALQKVKEGYVEGALANYGMVVQGSVSEAEDAARMRYAASVSDAGAATNPELATMERNNSALIEKESLLAEIRYHERRCAALKKAAHETGISLSESVLTFETLNGDKGGGPKHTDTVTQAVVSSTLHADKGAITSTSTSNRDAMLESVISLRQECDQSNALETLSALTIEQQQYFEVIQENSMLLQRLEILERQEKALLNRLSHALGESRVQTEINQNMQDMISSIHTTMHTQLDASIQLSALVSKIEENAFSLRPEIQQIKTQVMKNIAVSPCSSSSASFIDRLDD